MATRRTPIQVDVPAAEAMEVIDELNDMRDEQDYENPKEESEAENLQSASDSKGEDLNPKGLEILSERAQTSRMAPVNKQIKWEIHPADISWLAPNAEPPKIKPEGKTRLVYKCNYCENMSVDYNGLSFHMEVAHRVYVTQKNYHYGYIHDKKRLEELWAETEKEMEGDAEDVAESTSTYNQTDPEPNVM